jgi:hypothetical protein
VQLSSSAQQDSGQKLNPGLFDEEPFAGIRLEVCTCARKGRLKSDWASPCALPAIPLIWNFA